MTIAVDLGRKATKATTKQQYLIMESNYGLYSVFSLFNEIMNKRYILTSTKNASLIITDFLAMIKENEQRRTDSLCRGWAMLENDFNLTCR